MSVVAPKGKKRKSETRNIGRRASKIFRREQLINATIDSLAKHGYAATTLADIADGAGLSRGIINFHFESKENLLLETLKYLSREYDENRRAVLAELGDSPAERLHALVCANFNERIFTSRKVAAWFAFCSEAKTRQSCRALCWTRYDNAFVELVRLCETLIVSGGYALDPSIAANALCSLQAGLWLQMMSHGQRYNHKVAASAAHDVLCALFPMHFDKRGIR